MDQMTLPMLCWAWEVVVHWHQVLQKLGFVMENCMNIDLWGNTWLAKTSPTNVLATTVNYNAGRSFGGCYHASLSLSYLSKTIVSDISLKILVRFYFNPW